MIPPSYFNPVSLRPLWSDKYRFSSQLPFITWVISLSPNFLLYETGENYFMSKAGCEDELNYVS